MYNHYVQIRIYSSSYLMRGGGNCTSVLYMVPYNDGVIILNISQLLWKFCASKYLICVSYHWFFAHCMQKRIYKNLNFNMSTSLYHNNICIQKKVNWWASLHKLMTWENKLDCCQLLTRQQPEPEEDGVRHYQILNKY